MFLSCANAAGLRLGLGPLIPSSIVVVAIVDIFESRGVYFLVKGYWGCAAGWGRIFHSWTDYNGVAFLARVTRMESHIFGISVIRKFW